MFLSDFFMLYTSAKKRKIEAPEKTHQLRYTKS